MGVWLEVSSYSGLCPNICQACPRELYAKSCGNTKQVLSLKNFKKAINKLPSNNSVICFSGFVEPCIAPDISDMILYAYEKGFQTYLLTTLISWSIDNYNKVKDVLDYLSIHLPDNQGKTKININKKYLTLLKYIVKNPPNGEFLFNHHAGDVHDKIKNIVFESQLLQIHNRSGHLSEGIESNYPSANQCGHMFLFNNYSDGSGVLLPSLDVVSCCQDFSLKYIWGNLHTQSWDEIKKNIHSTDLCKKCICGGENYE